MDAATNGFFVLLGIVIGLIACASMITALVCREVWLISPGKRARAAEEQHKKLQSLIVKEANDLHLKLDDLIACLDGGVAKINFAQVYERVDDLHTSPTVEDRSIEKGGQLE